MSSKSLSLNGGVDSRGVANPLCETQLVAAAKRGHGEAFDSLFRSHEDSLLWAAFRITKQREDAEDAVQDSMMRAFLHIKDFDERSKFGTWLTRIAINSALMILRKKRSMPEISEEMLLGRKPDATLPHMADQAPNPEQNFSRMEREEILKNGIASLRPSIRTALEIRELQEHSVRETATMMGISVAATKARVFHAKRILRKKLRRGVLKTAPAYRSKRFEVPVHVLQNRESQMLQRSAA
jgi:RNA polymerase sigma-70 factor (ECF subfamily)